MNSLSKWMFLSATILAPASAYGQISCSRDGLRAATDLYVAAQTKGDTAGLPLAKGLSYVENMQPLDIATGLIKTAMKIDHHFSLLDTATCQTFTEVIVTDKAKPYVLGTRLRVNHGLIAEIETVWTTTGYWLFKADDYLKAAQEENWGAVPAEQRDSRATLEAAAGAYLDAFLEGKMDLVPWGQPCNRTEGGTRMPGENCQMGVPSGVNITNRHYVVDETIGAVVAFCTFGAGGPGGGSGSPDTHLFRLNNGKLRYAHTLTHLLQASFRGQGGQAPANTPPGARKQ